MNTKQQLAEKTRNLANCDVGKDKWSSELKTRVLSMSEREYGFFVVAYAVLETARSDRQKEIADIYKNAETAMKEGAFAKAQRLFESLGDYSDARQKASDAALKEQNRLEQERKRYEQEQENRRASKYNQANDYYRKAFATNRRGDFYYRIWNGNVKKSDDNPYQERNKLLQQAQSLFRELDGYRDSKEKLDSISQEYARQRDEEREQRLEKEKEKTEQKKREALQHAKFAEIIPSAKRAIDETLNGRWTYISTDDIRALSKRSELSSQIRSDQAELAKLEKEMRELRDERATTGLFEMGRKRDIDAKLSQVTARADSLRSAIRKNTSDSPEVECVWRAVSINLDEKTAMLAYVPPIHQMKFANTNRGATWKSSLVRKWLNGEFYQSLPASVRRAIVPTKRTVNHTGSIDYRGNYSHSYRDESRKEDEVEDKVFIPSSLQTVADCLHEFARPHKIEERYSRPQWIRLGGKIWLAAMTGDDQVLVINLDGKHDEVTNQLVGGGFRKSSKWPIAALSPTDESGLVFPLMRVDYTKLDVNWTGVKRPDMRRLTDAGWTREEATQEIDAMIARLKG